MLVLALGLASASAGCGGDDTLGRDTDGIDTVESFLTWNPSNTLRTKHENWHKPDNDPSLCSDAAGSIYRRCTDKGKNFFQFHREILSQLRDEYVANGGDLGAIVPWTRVPSRIRFSGEWTDYDAMQEARIMDLGTGGNRFAGLDDYGRFVENFLHGRLHVLSASVYGEPAIGPIPSSVTSTYFFKIHGLVEFLYQRFQRGDFNDDEYADFFERNTTTGENAIRMLSNNQSPPTPVSIESVGVNGCNYYVGATVDLDYDGINDLIWHGPGCNSTVLWKMGRNASGQIIHAGPDTNLPGVNSGWTLIGAGDFNQDMRPDLVWKNNSTLDVSIWAMSGKTYLGSLTYLDVPAGNTPIGVVDTYDDGAPEILLQVGSFGAKTYAVLSTWYSQGTTYANGSLNVQGVQALSNVNHGDMYDNFVGSGRFGSSRFASDLVFQRYTPGGKSYSFSLSDGNGGYTNATGASMNTSVTIQGPR